MTAVPDQGRRALHVIDPLEAEADALVGGEVEDDFRPKAAQ